MCIECVACHFTRKVLKAYYLTRISFMCKPTTFGFASLAAFVVVDQLKLGLGARAAAQGQAVAIGR